MKHICKIYILLLIAAVLCSSCVSTGASKPYQTDYSSRLSSDSENETGQPSSSTKNNQQNIQDIVDVFSEQLEKNKIGKDINSFYIPELFVDAKNQFSEMNPSISGSEGIMSMNFNHYNTPPSIC